MSNSNAIPSFLDDPASCLTAIAARPPSRDLWGMLSGTPASCVKDDENANLCSLYIRAVAQQLPASEIAAENVASASSSTMELEMIRAQRLMEVLDAVSTAATKCTPRLAITQTGILHALLVHPGFKSTSLTQVQVEFCQMALLAEQYRFAARVLQGQWPRPSATLSVRHTLRYFLLRGMIHVGCNDWTMAVRCFWTCLSVPAEVTSVLAIHAWKKMVLVQCLQMEDDNYRSAQEFQLQQRQAAQPSAVEAMIIEGAFAAGTSAPAPSTMMSGRGPLSLPKAIPNCVSRFLTMASNKQQQQQHQQRSSQQTNSPEEIGHMVQEELGEPSSQQHQQQRPQQAGSYSAMGVRVYMDLVSAFVAGDRTQFQSLLQQHDHLLQSDGNLGLVRQCETAMLHRQVYQMSRIFSVIPLTDLAAKLKMESTDGLKDLLHQLSLEKSFTCSKDVKWPSIEVEDDGMVVFTFETPSLPEEFNGMMEEGQPDNTLDDGIQELIKLTKEVEKLDVAIATSPMYHALVRRAQDAKMGGPRGVEDL